MDRAASAEGGDSVADLNDQEVAAERSAGGLLLEGQGAGFFSFSSGQESVQHRENRCPRGANSGWMCGTRQASGHRAQVRGQILPLGWRKYLLSDESQLPQPQPEASCDP